MADRKFMKLLPALALFVSGTAFAQGAGGGAGGGAAGAPSGLGAGVTSGAAAGTDAQPSTAIHKQKTGRSSASGGQLQGSSDAAGAPAIEGQPGTQSGSPHEGQTHPSSKQ